MKSRKMHLDEARQVKETSTTNDAPPTQLILLTIRQTAQQLGLSEATVYRLAAVEGLPTVKFGRSTRIVYDSLWHWVKERENEQRAY